MTIILGSESPRRKEILHFFSVPFTQSSSNFDEESIHYEGDPRQYVETLAIKKAEALSKLHKNKPILTADTAVFCKGKVYNKPKNRTEAVSFLSELSGETHSVFTGVALFHQNAVHVLSEETKIVFHKLTSDQINHYLDNIKFLDKAGAYAIQNGGGLLVKKLEGCYYNVMGLPLHPLKELLKKAEIDLWAHIKCF